MAYAKTHDLTVKTGEYTNSYGETKGRYENVGMVMTGDDGNQMFLLKRTFNPAGVPNPDGKDSVLVSMFEVRDRQGSGQQQQAAPQQRYQDQQLDDEIPFV